MSLKDLVVKLLNSSDTVFIVGHNNPDFDSLGASVGVSLICEKYNKKSYIIANGDYQQMDKSTALVLDDIKSRFNVVKADQVENLKGNKNLLIVLDTNKEHRIEVDSEGFDDVLIIDHHLTDDKTIKNSYKYINTSSSSTCEIVEKLMHDMKVKFNPKRFANYLYAGIKLDTRDFDKATNLTHDAAGRLIKAGADTTFVSNLFIEDFDRDRLVQNLISETKIFNIFYPIAIACQNSNSNVYYTRKDLARIADYLLKFYPNASFSIGKLDNENYYISARSKGLINIGNIMSRFSDGGGTLCSGAAKIPSFDLSLEEVEKQLIGYIASDNKEKDEVVKRLKL